MASKVFEGEEVEGLPRHEIQGRAVQKQVAENLLGGAVKIGALFAPPG